MTTQPTTKQTQAIAQLIHTINEDLIELTNYTHNENDKPLTAYACGAHDSLTLVKHELENIISLTPEPTHAPKQRRKGLRVSKDDLIASILIIIATIIAWWGSKHHF